MNQKAADDTERITVDKPSCNVFLNIKSNTFLIESLIIDSEFGWYASCGKFQHITDDEIKNCGLNYIMHNIKEFKRREKKELSEHDKMTSVQYRRFHKNHKQVGIDSDNSNTLRITPMHRCRGGRVGKEGEEMYIQLPCSNEDFYNILMEAFDKC